MPRLPQPVIKQNRIKQEGQPRCGCPSCLRWEVFFNLRWPVFLARRGKSAVR